MTFEYDNSMISGLGFQEIIIIAIIVLVVFGPQRLPELMRNLGKITRDLRRIAWEFRSALDLETLDDDVEKLRNSKSEGLYPEDEPEEPDQPDDPDRPDEPDEPEKMH